MLLEKRQLGHDELDAQTAVELPERMVLSYSLVYISVTTGDINVLSYNEIGTCATAAVGIADAGDVILQNCVAVTVS